MAFPIVCGLPLPCKHPSVKIRNWSTLRRILNFMETMDGKRTPPQLVTHCWTLKTQGVMPPTSALLLLISSYPLLVLSIPHWCRHPLAHSNHTPRPAHHPNSCQFGSGPGPCGGDVCLKGPGDVCGGARDRYGKCAEGLLCSDCNRYYMDGERKYSYGLMFHVFRCQGCSLISFTCWYDDECISW